MLSPTSNNSSKTRHTRRVITFCYELPLSIVFFYYSFLRAKISKGKNIHNLSIAIHCSKHVFVLTYAILKATLELIQLLPPFYRWRNWDMGWFSKDDPAKTWSTRIQTKATRLQSEVLTLTLTPETIRRNKPHLNPWYIMANLCHLTLIKSFSVKVKRSYDDKSV